MSKIEERMALIENSVLSVAQQKSQDIIRQADDYKKREIEKIENEVLSELYNKIQEEIAQIRNGATMDLSRQEAQEHQKLLNKREELSNSIFAAVRQRLAAYTKTPEYTQYMLRITREIAENFDYADGFFMLREDDFDMVDTLEEILQHKCHIRMDPTIKIGGVRLVCEHTNLSVDETLDEKLAEQKRWFYAHSELGVG